MILVYNVIIHFLIAQEIIVIPPENLMDSTSNVGPKIELENFSEIRRPHFISEILPA